MGVIGFQQRAPKGAGGRAGGANDFGTLLRSLENKLHNTH